MELPFFYFKRLTKDHSHFSPQLLKSLWSKHRRYDAIHVHSWWNLVSVFSVLICWIRGRKVVLSPRGMLSDYTYQTNHSFIKKIIHKTIGSFLLKKVFFHATSTKEQNEIKQLFPSAPVKVVPNFVWIPVTTPSKKDHEKFRLVFLSRIDPKKGLELLMNSLKNISLDYHLSVADSGNEEYIQTLKAMAISLEIDSRISWLGTIHGEQKFNILSEHDLLILPSFNENFANVVIESLSVGTPVLVSEQVGLSDYVEENNFGWICKTDAKDLSEKIMQAYSEIEKRKQIERNAEQKIREDYSIEKLTGEYLNLYSQ